MGARCAARGESARCGDQHAAPAATADGYEQPDFVERVTAALLAGRGDLLPVSALPVDGTFPTATAQLEKRSIAHEIPIWDPDICIQCGLCALVCPHATIRMKAFEPEALDGGPRRASLTGRGGQGAATM